MHIFSNYPEAVDSIAQAIGCGDAHPDEYDMSAIEAALVQRFEVGPMDVRYYVAAQRIDACDLDELVQRLDDDAYDITQAFWDVIAAHQLPDA